MKKTVLFLGATVILSSCATFLRKDFSDSVTLKPSQEETLIFVNNDYKGIGEVTVEMDPREKYEITYLKPYYLAKSFDMEATVLRKWLIADLASIPVTGPVPVIVDAVTGAWKGFDVEGANNQEMIHWSDIEDPSLYLNQVFQIENLYFELNSDQLKPESLDNLNKLAEFLKIYPAANIMIHGHTDVQGDAAYNKELSRKRSESVKKYLVEKGVKQSSITTKGHGEEDVLLEGDTEFAHRYNRRVEFEFIP
jgi:outer membrane protein OmpA-like peptidoglycan-associated protein